MPDPVPDPEFYRFLASLGVGGAIAAILFFFYRKDVRSYTELWREATNEARAQTVMMVEVVKENTAAFTQNTEVVRSLHKRLDRLEDAEARDEAHGRRRP